MTNHEPDDWTEQASGEIRIGSDAPVPIEMSRWHWRTLAHLERDHGVDVAAALAEMRTLTPGVSADQLTMWYVELAFDSVLTIEQEEDAAQV